MALVRARLPTILLAATGAVAVAAGCGDGKRAASTAPEEKADAPAKLPAGWTRVVNKRAGFTIGLPPGWIARGSRGTTLVRSFDGAVAAGISADRSDVALTQPLPAYARATFAGLRGYGRLVPGRPVPVKGAQYPTLRVSASGTFARTKVPQAITLYAIRRPGQVTYSLLFFRNAKSPAAVYTPAIAGMVRTLRATPPEF